MAGREDFEQYVAARQAALLRTAYLLTGNPADAEDLVQEALIKAAASWSRIEEPDAYVRRILVHENISRWRRRRWREVSSDELPERAVDSADRTDLLALHHALGELSPRQRAVVVLRFHEDRTEAETAEMLGISVGTVKSHSREARKRLRTLLPAEAPP